MARIEPVRGVVIPKRVRAFITPEGVDLRLTVAEAGERAAAFLLDALMIIGFLIVFSLLAMLAGVSTLFSGDGVGSAAGEVVVSLWLLVFFVTRYAWFVLWELGPRAATPGKRINGLRVAARDGGRLTAEAVFVRNAMRELEVFLPLMVLLQPGEGADGLTKLAAIVWLGIFVFFPLFNADRLRVGDLVAGTWVVKAPRRKLLADLAERRASQPQAQGFAFTPEQAFAYGEKELTVLEEVLRAKDVRTMKAVAERIRAKIRWTAAPGETDAAFLDAYYAALRERLEGGLLYGRRKKDKFDTLAR